MRTSRIVLVSTGCVAIYGLALLSGPARESYAQNPPQSQGEPKVAAPAASPGTFPSLPSVEPEPVPDAPAATPAVSVPSSPRTAPNQDPEKFALEFVEKNQKIADQELAKLKTEAETLRARLLKVEAGIRRWEAVAHALKQSEGVASKADGSWKPESFPRSSKIEFDVDTPSDLEAIPPAKVERATPQPSQKLKLKPSASTGSDLAPPVAPSAETDQVLLPVAPSAPTEATELEPIKKPKS